jgi:hypothetical protein
MDERDVCPEVLARVRELERAYATISRAGDAAETDEEQRAAWRTLAGFAELVAIASSRALGPSGLTSRAFDQEWTEMHYAAKRLRQALARRAEER